MYLRMEGGEVTERLAGSSGRRSLTHHHPPRNSLPIIPIQRLPQPLQPLLRIRRRPTPLELGHQPLHHARPALPPLHAPKHIHKPLALRMSQIKPARTGISGEKLALRGIPRPEKLERVDSLAPHPRDLAPVDV